MPKGVYQRNKGGGTAAPVFHQQEGNGPVTEVAPNPAQPTKMVAVKLLKNYVPMGHYEIVGHNQPEIKAKDAAGREVIKQEAAFIKGEMAPPPYPGVGYAGKIWAETTIRLPEAEARRLYDSRLAERGFDD